MRFHGPDADITWFISIFVILSIGIILIKFYRLNKKKQHDDDAKADLDASKKLALFVILPIILVSIIMAIYTSYFKQAQKIISDAENQRPGVVKEAGDKAKVLEWIIRAIRAASEEKKVAKTLEEAKKIQQDINEMEKWHANMKRPGASKQLTEAQKVKLRLYDVSRGAGVANVAPELDEIGSMLAKGMPVRGGYIRDPQITSMIRSGKLKPSCPWREGTNGSIILEPGNKIVTFECNGNIYRAKGKLVGPAPDTKEPQSTGKPVIEPEPESVIDHQGPEPAPEPEVVPEPVPEPVGAVKPEAPPPKKNVNQDSFAGHSPLPSENDKSPKPSIRNRLKNFWEKMLAENSEEADAWKQMNDRATVAETARSYLISKANEIKELRSQLEKIDPSSLLFAEKSEELRKAQTNLRDMVGRFKKEFHAVPQSVENALPADLNLADLGPEYFITNNGKLTLEYPMSAEQAANMSSKPGIRIVSKDANGNFILEFNKADYGKSLTRADMQQFIKDVTPTVDPFKTIQPGDINEALIKAQFDRVRALERKYVVQRMAGQDTAAISGELQKARGVLSALKNTTETNVNSVVKKIQESVNDVGFNEKTYDPRTGRIAIKPKDELIKEIHNTFPNEDALNLLKERGFEIVEPGQTYMPPVTLSGSDALHPKAYRGPEAEHLMIIPENVDVGGGIMMPNHFRPVIHRNGDVHVKARKGGLNTQDNASDFQRNPEGIQINDNVAIFNQEHPLYGILKDNAKPSTGVITDKILRWGGKVDPATNKKGIGILPKILVPGAAWEATADFTYPKLSPHHLLGDIIRWAKEPNTQTAANANPGGATVKTKPAPNGSSGGDAATTGGSPEAIANNNKENNTAESIGNALDPFVFSPFRGNKMNIGGYPIGHSIFGALAGGALGAGIGGLNYILTDENELSEEEKKKRSLARAMLSSAGIGAGIGGAIGGVSDFSKS